MKRTLERELKVLEIAEGEANGTKTLDQGSQWAIPTPLGSLAAIGWVPTVKIRFKAHLYTGAIYVSKKSPMPWAGMLVFMSGCSIGSSEFLSAWLVERANEQDQLLGVQCNNSPVVPFSFGECDGLSS